MALTQIVQFCWQLMLALLPAGAWLVFCRFAPPLRKRVGASYAVAFFIMLLSCALSRNGLTRPGMLACAFAVIILYVGWKQALKNRSLEANTIIGFHRDDLF